MSEKMWKDRESDDREREPYMATVVVNRTQSNGTYLFDSDAKHDNFVTLSIHRASRERRHGGNYVYAEGEVMQVAMTESQWATMVSSMGVGSGTPATLQREGGHRIQPPPAPDNNREKFDNDMVTIVEEIIERVDRLAEGKHTKATKFELRIISDFLRKNIPFIRDRFDEHMEERTDRAKTEVEAHMNAMIQRAGMESLLTQARAQQQRLEDTEFEHYGNAPPPGDDYEGGFDK
ncbi:hypothetical protein RPALISO_176 [Ruegeria phage RpAliso]|nr:hypothetical protein RPALISO_176 [Ruegeria phage RpAliso]